MTAEQGEAVGQTEEADGMEEDEQRQQQQQEAAGDREAEGAAPAAKKRRGAGRLSADGVGGAGYQYILQKDEEWMSNVGCSTAKMDPKFQPTGGPAQFCWPPQYTWSVKSRQHVSTCVVSLTVAFQS